MKKARVLVSVLMAGSVMAVPVVAGATASTTVSSTVSPVITMSSSGTVNINTTPAGAGVQTIASDTVSVSTNDSAGYTLKLNETSAASALTSAGNSIAATSGTQASPVAETANKWGYRVDGVGGFGAGPTSGATNATISAIKFAAVPVTASPDTLKTTATTATNDATTVWYGVATDTSVPSGTYTNSVTYTATAN